MYNSNNERKKLIENLTLFTIETSQLNLIKISSVLLKPFHAASWRAVLPCWKQFYSSFEKYGFKNIFTKSLQQRNNLINILIIHLKFIKKPFYEQKLTGHSLSSRRLWITSMNSQRIEGKNRGTKDNKKEGTKRKKEGAK